MAGHIDIIDKRVLVIGLGVTGWSCLRWLQGRVAGLAVLDTRPSPPCAELLNDSGFDVERYFGTDKLHNVSAFDVLVVSPGVDLQLPVIRQAREQGIPVIGDIELFTSAVAAPVAAITGSNGKSTVTTLLASMAETAGLRVAAGGNLGTPALDLLDESVELYVLELSSFQLEITESLSPAAAVVLNISADHLDRHGSVKDYAAIKARVYRSARRAVVNRDDRLAAGDFGNSETSLGFTGMLPQATDYGLVDEGGQTWLLRGQERLISQAELKMPGRHNALNALAALAMGESLGLETGAMLRALREFKGLPHRCEWVREHNAVQWINDSKGTNVGATVAAIHGLPGPLILLAGGQGKGADFAPLGDVLADKGKAAVLYGEDAATIESALQDLLPVYRTEKLAEAVCKAAELAAPGDTVLLSPACASLDQFSNYMQRGEQFCAAVRALA